LSGLKSTRYPQADPQVYLDLARERIAVQLETLDALDNKIGLLFTTSCALLGILAAVVALKVSKLSNGDLAGLAVSIWLFWLVGFQTEFAYRQRSWRTGPELKQLWRQFVRTQDEKGLHWEIANRIRLDYERNKEPAVIKEHALSVILPLVIAQSLVLVLALVLVAEGL
jgi:hypothetical protein